jgi:hypothetical protein
MYDLEIRLASKNGWHTPDEARRYYGKYSREGMTWHWWNSPDLAKDSDHDNIVNYILGKASRGTGSVNYVLSNHKITMLVNPDNVAWASQSGNPTTVSVELSPHLDAEGYKKAGWLAWQLEQRYGRTLRFYKHSDWYKTSCPGTIDPNRIRAEADKWKNGGYNPAPVEPPKPPVGTPLIDEWTLWKDGEITYSANKPQTHLYDLSTAKKWPDVKIVKTFDQGARLVLVGSFKNTALNATYYVTRYSFDRKVANGFNPVDLDIYVEPDRPPIVPVEPEQPTDPVEPTDPVIPPDVDPNPPEPDPPTDTYPSWFTNFWLQLIDALKGILGIK